MEANLAVLDVTKKAAIYHILYQFNSAFESIVGCYQRLRETGLLDARSTRRYQGFAQEVQSESNQEFLEAMESIETEDWNRFGKVREQWEKYIRDPDDVFIHAAERRSEMKKEARKKKTAKEQRKRNTRTKHPA
jgi:pyruvate-formate lyase